MSNCSYCSEFENDSDGSYYLRNISSQVGDIRIRLESDNFCVYPSVGSLVVGHLLIVPKKHYTALSLASSEDLTELSDIISDIKALHKLMLGDTDIFMFEHGILDVDKSMMNCVDHAHMHVLPISIDASTLPFSKSTVLTLAALADQEINYPDYIFYGTPECSFLSLDRDKHPQYLRKLLHEYLSLEGHWNWRTDPKIENIKAWLRQFSELVNKNNFQFSEMTRLRLIA